MTSANNSTEYTISVDWARIHFSCAEIDDARRGTQIGREGCADAFGGRYPGTYWEGRGLVGLVSVVGAANTIAEHAWHVVHQASRRMDAARLVSARDLVIHAVVDGDDNVVREYATGRGARVAATRRGLRAVRLTRPDVLGTMRLRAEAIARVETEARSAVRVALALHDLRLALRDAGVIEYRPSESLCGVTDTIQLTGLRWLAGESQERDGVSVEAARAFVAGGVGALRAALAAA